jgi:hypothetical protein
MISMLIRQLMLLEVLLNAKKFVLKAFVWEILLLVVLLNLKLLVIFIRFWKERKLFNMLK